MRVADISDARCKHGHVLTERTVYIYPSGKAACRVCRTEGRRRRCGSDPNYILKHLRTHCPKGHAYTAENTYINKRGNRSCKQCKRDRNNADSRNGRIGIATLRKAIERLHSGETLFNLNGRRGANRKAGKHSINLTTLRNFLKRRPALNKRLLAISRANAIAHYKEATNARRLICASGLVKNHGIDAFAAISAATVSLPDFLRDDVRSAMFLAAAEGRLHPRDAAKHVLEFVTAHNRQFSKFVPGGGIMRSLDEQVYDDGPTRLVDTITRGLWS